MKCGESTGIARNDNRAVYRSRFLLDQDLAARNVNLATLYGELGLNAWARNKALKSIKADYGNFDGHLFYAGALLGLEGRSYSFSSEAFSLTALQRSAPMRPSHSIELATRKGTSHRHSWMRSTDRSRRLGTTSDLS